MKIKKSYKLWIKKPLFAFIILILIFGVSINITNASVLSFLKGLFDANFDNTQTINYKNSQNIILLSAALNNDPNPSKGGGSIKIVDESALQADIGPVVFSQDVKAKRKTDQISVYVVREGDTLSQIAELFNVTIETILWSNDIGEKGTIKPGQTLVILPVSGVRHTVKSGDTLNSIAKKYNADAEEIASFNEIHDNTVLNIGEELIIPHGKKDRVINRKSSKVVHGSNAPLYSNYYISPLKKYVKSQGLHGYNAVDLAVPTGSPILAAASGRVLISRSGWNGGYGNYIVIVHSNGTQTVYAHNSKNIVYAGQNVVQGQVIGYSGSTGRSTGPHLHFEVRGAKNPF